MRKRQFFCESTNDTLACVIFVKFESRAAASVLYERERERERPEEAASRTEVTLYRYKYIYIYIYIKVAERFSYLRLYSTYVINTLRKYDEWDFYA